MQQTDPSKLQNLSSSVIQRSGRNFNSSDSSSMPICKRFVSRLAAQPRSKWSYLLTSPELRSGPPPLLLKISCTYAFHLRKPLRVYLIHLQKKSPLSSRVVSDTDFRHEDTVYPSKQQS